MLQAAVAGYKYSKGSSKDSSAKTVITPYKVESETSIAVRSRPGDQYYNYGTLVYGDKIDVVEIKDGWAKIDYRGKTAFCPSTGLKESSASSSMLNGLWITAVLARRNWASNGADEILQCGVFELDSVSASGPPATITIKATSLPFKSSIRKTKKTRAWEDTDLRELVKLITDESNMGLLYLAKENPKYKRIEQYKESDIAFLKRLCNDAGCSLKVTNNVLVIFNQAEYEAKPSIRTIERGDGYERYKLATKDDGTYTSCCVSYTQTDGTIIKGMAYVEDYNSKDEKNQCLNISRKVEDEEEAKKLANELLRLHNKYAFEGVFTYPFDPSLCAGCTIKIGASFGAFAGKYMIKQAKHSVGSKSSTTQITLRPVL